MTPLAQRIVRELTMPVKDRTFVDQSSLLPEMNDIHCFEVTGVLDGINAMLTANLPEGSAGSAEMAARIEALAGNTSFLPAPKTWIEWAYKDNMRMGFLLQESDGFAMAIAAGGSMAHGGASSLNFLFSFGLGAKGKASNHWHCTRDLSHDEERAVMEFIATLNGALAFINSPKVIGREEYHPHRGLEKKLASSFGRQKPFKLHPWTEIKLHVTPSEVAETGEREGHLTGQRALHFCRSHLRIRNGRLEQVRAHWRGDPSLGVRQSRYKVVA